MFKHYTTRPEAVEAEIIAPLEVSGADAAAEYDVDAIADAVIEFVHVGAHEAPAFRCAVEPAEFWQIVEANAKAGA